jgi:DNA-binding transcriptional ArsR family regulator
MKRIKTVTPTNLSESDGSLSRKGLMYQLIHPKMWLVSAWIQYALCINRNKSESNSGSEIREQKSRIAKFTLDIDQTMHNHMVVDHLGTTFAALSDPTRRAMIERLSHGPASVHGLTEPFALSQQMISKHIACLVRARMVIKTKRGRESVCTLRPEAIKTVSDWAISYRRFWEESFDKLDVVVNQMKKEVRDDKQHG